MNREYDYTLIKNAEHIVTVDKSDTVYENADILIRNGVIEAVGKCIEIPKGEKSGIINAEGCIVYPGLINVHHHLYQTFTRNIPKVQNMELFPWLKTLYEIWRNLDEESIYYSSLTGMAELVKYGCTTVMDHHYVFPKKRSEHFIDMQFKAADELGVRFYATRGSMSRGVSDGGLPPDDLVQDIDTILKDSERLVAKYHDARRYSMHGVGFAPCSPFSVTKDLLVESAKLARSLGVRLHTHLCETKDEEKFCLEAVGVRPLEYMIECGWIGSDVWFAHGIHFTDEELKILADTGTGIAHCPSSNMKLSSGVCKIPDMIELKIPVGLAVDGSASNDNSNMMSEIRTSYLLHRLTYSNHAPSGYDILKLATKGSASVLGRDDIGSIEKGKAADLFMLDIRNFEMVGAKSSPKDLIGTVGVSRYPKLVMIQGKVTAKNGHLTSIDEEKKAYEADEAAKKFISQ